MDKLNNLINAQCSDNNPFRTKVDTIIKELTASEMGVGISGIKDIVFLLYTRLFNKVPHCIEFDADGEYLNINADYMYSDKAKCDDDAFITIGDEEYALSEFEPADEESANKIAAIRDTIAKNNAANKSQYKKENIYTFHDKEIMLQSTYLNIINNYDGEIAVYRVEENPVIILGNDVKTIIYYKDHYMMALSPKPELDPYIIENVVLEDEESERYFEYVVYDSRSGFDTTDLPVKNQNIDLRMNYNDDLPDHAIKAFCENKDSGICIIFGNPGTGKTSYIRHLMHTCKDVNFLILNPSCFDAINDTSFVNLIISHKDSVIILEDCEDLLSERLNGNSRIATLLNLSDGILGDSLRLKFICTFNAKISKIDPAVLRKGRTHVKYEFKPLTVEKAKALAESIGHVLPSKKGNDGYTLAEIYYSDNNLVEGNVTNKVGFTKK